MHILLDTKVDYEAECKKASVILERITALLTNGQPHTIASECLMTNKDEYKDKYLLIKDGVVVLSRNGEKLIFFEKGDLVGLDFQLGEGIELSSDFAVEAVIYDKHEFEQAIQEDTHLVAEWLVYMRLQAKVYASLLMSIAATGFDMDRQLKTYEVEDIIIEEGDEAHEVYTLLEGSAEVYVGDVMVGEVHEDEIFGALAALTDSPRTGRVIASSNHTQVIAVPKEDFSKLIASRPQTVLKMVEDMARTIKSLNEQVVELTNRKDKKVY